VRRHVGMSLYMPAASISQDAVFISPRFKMNNSFTYNRNSAGT